MRGSHLQPSRLSPCNGTGGREISRFLSGETSREDLLLLNFSGHGIKNARGELYLGVVDTEYDLLGATAIPASFISSEMDSSASRRLVLILDCCHSGAFLRGTKGVIGESVGIEGAFAGSGSGRIILTATDSTQYAWEGGELSGQAQSSVFTHFMVEGLRSGHADLDFDGLITVDELYDYVHDKVIQHTPHQRPRKFVINQDGGLALASVPADRARPAELPPELLAAIGSVVAGARLDAVAQLDTLLRGRHSGLALAAETALRELCKDDSRRVAEAAAASREAHRTRLKPVEPQAPTPPATDDRPATAPSAGLHIGPVAPAVRAPAPRPGLLSFWISLSPGTRASVAVVVAAALVAGLVPAARFALSQAGPAVPSRSTSPSPATTTPRPTAVTPGTWSPAHQMAAPRELHSSTLLRDGRVLVAGGVSGSNASAVLNSAELYNPASGAWSPTGQMKTARAAHTATLLVDGRVLVVGGLGSDLQSLGSAELYDPRSGTWSSAVSLHDSRAHHQALLLPNGRVIVIGGNTRSAGLEQSLATVEIYDPGPGSGAWLAAPAMSTPRSGPAAILPQDKRVLVAGGSAGSGGAAAAAPLSSAELYDYRTYSWARTGSMATSHAQHTATLLNDGRVLVAGGAAVAELYSPAAGTWAPAADPPAEFRDQTAVLLLSGGVLTAGGAIGNTVIGGCNLYDPVSNVWLRCPDMSVPRWSHAMTTRQSGQVLVTGGAPVAVKTATPVAGAEVYRG